MYKGNVKSSEDFMLLLGRLKTAARAETYRKHREGKTGSKYLGQRRRRTINVFHTCTIGDRIYRDLISIITQNK